jgi:hypothetical protein|tara:strand:- start:55 stop:186 length:132 start_codon:yes stop_codon:yes gene_type:complete
MITTSVTVEEYIPGGNPDRGETPGYIKTSNVTIELPEKEEGSE